MNKSSLIAAFSVCVIACACDKGSSTASHDAGAQMPPWLTANSAPAPGASSRPSVIARLPGMAERVTALCGRMAGWTRLNTKPCQECLKGNPTGPTVSCREQIAVMNACMQALPERGQDAMLECPARCKGACQCTIECRARSGPMCLEVYMKQEECTADSCASSCQ